MIIFFQNILLSKEFLACIGCFGLFTKMKKGSGRNFWCPFSAWFFHKSVFYLILYQWTRFQCHTFFPSQYIKQNVLLRSYLDSWWHDKNFKIYPQKTSYAMADREKKSEDGNTKTWISQERKELFRWNKKHLHSFWRAIIWLKIKIWSKIADTSFKHTSSQFPLRTLSPPFIRRPWSFTKTDSVIG